MTRISLFPHTLTRVQQSPEITYEARVQRLHQQSTAGSPWIISAVSWEAWTYASMVASQHFNSIKPYSSHTHVQLLVIPLTFKAKPSNRLLILIRVTKDHRDENQDVYKIVKVTSKAPASLKMGKHVQESSQAFMAPLNPFNVPAS